MGFVQANKKRQMVACIYITIESYGSFTFGIAPVKPLFSCFARHTFKVWFTKSFTNMNHGKKKGAESERKYQQQKDIDNDS